MGKARKLKLIRRVANQLPAMETKAFTNERIMGYELIEKGVKTLSNGTEVKPQEKYLKRQASPVPVNHNRQMKKLYNQHGMAGCVHYANTVDKMAEERKKPVPVAEPVRAQTL